MATTHGSEPVMRPYCETASFSAAAGAAHTQAAASAATNPILFMALLLGEILSSRNHETQRIADPRHAYGKPPTAGRPDGDAERQGARRNLLARSPGAAGEAGGPRNRRQATRSR